MTKKEAKKIEEAIISLNAYDVLITNAIEKHNHTDFLYWCNKHDQETLALRSMGINIGQTFKEREALKA